MLVSFSVENFRSFNGEQTLNLVANEKLTGQHESHAVAIPGSNKRVLKSAVIYGANGAGKSNLFKAIDFLRSAATSPRRKGTGVARQAFRFGDANKEPSQLDIQFISNKKLYRYGIVVDDQQIIEEWLLAGSGAKERVVFERTTADDGEVLVKWGPKQRPNEKMRALGTVGGPPNQTFLATVFDYLHEDDIAEEVSDALTWFEDYLRLVRPDGPVVPIGHYMSEKKDFAKFAGEFLRASSTGVEGLEVNREEISLDDLKTILGKQAYAHFNRQIDEMEVGEATILSNGKEELLIEKGQESHFYRLIVEATHNCGDGRTVSLSLIDESDGTRRLLDLMPALDGTEGPHVFFIDEIERSLHPALLKRFMEYFLNTVSESDRQIIVTTHESHLLDLDLLRRDEIWFAEKGRSLDTHLYSLADFKVRTDLAIRKHYFAGRFGAIPFLGDIDRLASSNSPGDADVKA